MLSWGLIPPASVGHCEGKAKALPFLAAYDPFLPSSKARIESLEGILPKLSQPFVYLIHIYRAPAWLLQARC